MKAVVICPDRRLEVTFLARKTPLALVPVLGPSVLAHWLTHLAEKGIKEITILASDRPDQIRAAVGRGERWGVKLEVLAEARELSGAEAQKRFGLENIIVADRLPALPEQPLFENYAGFFAALKNFLPLAQQHRVGAREIAPNIWAGLRCKIDSGAKLTAPCWLGENVWIRDGAVVGPDAFVEDGALVDGHAEVAASWIGPRTYVGAMTQVKNSCAWADGLLNHANGSFAEIVDAFLLGDLQGAQGFRRNSPWYGQLAALALLVLTSPVLLVAWLKNRGAKNLFVKKRAVIPTAVTGTASLREMDYSELDCFRGKWRRWPQLWSVTRGDFTWVGNRPLTREQARQLETEFEQLWLAAPVGLFSLADTFGGDGKFDDETRAHSSFYAVRSGARLDREILRKVFLRSSQKP
jgi:Bacterial sugar transferase